jgi:hypothetical protein
MCQQLCFKMTHVYTRNDGVPNYPWCTSSWSPLVISHYLMFAECLEVEVPPQVLSSHLLNTPNDEKHTLSLYKLLLGKLNIYHWRKKEKQTNNRDRVQGQSQCLSNVERNKTLCSLLSGSSDQILQGRPTVVAHKHTCSGSTAAEATFPESKETVVKWKALGVSAWRQFITCVGKSDNGLAF